MKLLESTWLHRGVRSIKISVMSRLVNGIFNKIKDLRYFQRHFRTLNEPKFFSKQHIYIYMYSKLVKHFEW